MTKRWVPIQDYKGSPAELAQAELRPLAQVWREQYDRLKDRYAFRQFDERLRREWAVETGLIERLYTLDRGVTELLIDRGINVASIPHKSAQNPQSIVSMIEDHKGAVDAIFDFVKGDRHCPPATLRSCTL